MLISYVEVIKYISLIFMSHLYNLDFVNILMITLLFFIFRSFLIIHIFILFSLYDNPLLSQIEKNLME